MQQNIDDFASILQALSKLPKCKQLGKTKEKKKISKNNN
jgi:hypothetical protein